MTSPVGIVTGALSRAVHCLVGYGPTCRFTPSCSEYVRRAVEQHGAVKGIRLGAGRILRCHPFGGSGWDPVPVLKGRHHGK